MWVPRYQVGDRLMNSRGAIREVVNNFMISESGKRVGYVLKRVTINPDQQPAETRPVGGIFFCDRGTVEDGGTYKHLDKLVEKALCA